MDIKIIVEKLIDPFLKAGDLSMSLREKGLKKEIKSDNTPVSNGDLEVNKFITKKISEITPDIPIISEETSDNKDNAQLKDFWLVDRSEEHTSELQSRLHLVCRLLLEKKNKTHTNSFTNTNDS